MEKSEGERSLHLGSLPFDRHSRALPLRETSGAFPSTEDRYRPLGYDSRREGCDQTSGRFRGERSCDNYRGCVVQLAKHAPTLVEQMMHLEERTSDNNLPHDVDISQQKIIHPEGRSAPASTVDRRLCEYADMFEGFRLEPAPLRCLRSPCSRSGSSGVLLILGAQYHQFFSEQGRLNYIWPSLGEMESTAGNASSLKTASLSRRTLLGF